jgi:acetoacetyl-CoA reductase/3-oxoacyl-[acyl-carrier protein] reductase
MDMSDRNVVVTGATRGLGAGLVRQLSALGATVIGTGRTERPPDQVPPDRYHFYRADLSSAADCASFCANVLKEHGAPHVVINNAGINRVRPIVDASDDDWDAIVDTNLRAPFQITRGFLPAMVENGGGTFIHIASINAVIGVKNMAPYNASKAGLVHFSRTLAVEHAASDIASIAVILGGVATEMSGEIQGEMKSVVTGQSSGPLEPRGFTADQAAAALALLCTEQAKLFTGSAMCLDGAASAGLLASSMIYLSVQ